MAFDGVRSVQLSNAVLAGYPLGDQERPRRCDPCKTGLLLLNSVIAHTSVSLATIDRMNYCMLDSRKKSRISCMLAPSVLHMQVFCLQGFFTI